MTPVECFKAHEQSLRFCTAADYMKCLIRRVRISCCVSIAILVGAVTNPRCAVASPNARLPLVGVSANVLLNNVVTAAGR